MKIDWTKFKAILSVIFGIIAWLIGAVVCIIFLCYLLKNQIDFIGNFHAIFFLLACILLLFSICGIFRKRFNWGYNFFQFFFSKHTWVKTTTIFALTLFFPIILFFVCGHEHYETDKGFSLISNWGIVLSLISVIVGMKIYMQIDENRKKHTFTQFIEHLCDFFRNSNTKTDNIKLCLPTLHIGAAGETNATLSNKFKDNIKDFIRKSKQEEAQGSLNIAILDYDLASIREFKEEYDTKIKEAKVKRYAQLNANNQTPIKNKLGQNTSLLFQFHRTWNRFKNENDEIAFYYKLAEFTIELEDLKIELEDLKQDYKFTITKLTKDYFCKQNGEDAPYTCSKEAKDGLFLFIKTNPSNNRADVYLGNIYINAQEKLEFHNTIIEGLPVGTEFRALYDSFVNTRRRRQ
jgi:hypothetical protein